MKINNNIQTNLIRFETKSKTWISLHYLAFSLILISNFYIRSMKKKFMKKKNSKISTLLILSILISFNAYAQWTYPDAKPIENDVMIIYDVKYDRVLSEEEKQSYTFKKEIIMVFNNDKLLKKIVSNRGETETKTETFNLLDYDKEMLYQCWKSDTKGGAISSKFRNPNKETILQEGKEVTMLGLPCQVSTTIMKGETREIYTTKEFPLKYVREFKTEGFLMKYVSNSKSLGTYTATARKIYYTDELEEGFYNLEGYTIKDRKEYYKEKNKRSTLAKEAAIEKIGTPAPKYSVRSIDGKKLKSKDMMGKVVVLNFWFTSCSPCKKEIPQLNELREKFKDENVEFIAVSLDPEYKLSTFLEKHPFTYDIVEDGRWIAGNFEIKSYPSNIIIDKNGNIQFYKIGYKTDITEMMSYKIEKLLNH